MFLTNLLYTIFCRLQTNMQPLNISEIRHSKEKIYFGLSVAFGAILWLNIIGFSFFIIKNDPKIAPAFIIYPLIYALVIWLSEQFFKVVILGNAIKISKSQYPQLNDIVEEQALALQLKKVPDVFIVNGEGLVNAVAIGFLSNKRYVILLSDLVDLMLERGQIEELKMVIGHELAHHAAGHTNFLKNLLILPAKFVPFLGAAYRRSMEYTADKIGLELINDVSTAQRALLSVTSGSLNLANDINIEAFKQQEKEVSAFFGFIHNAFASYPRMTQRVIELEKFQKATIANSKLNLESPQTPPERIYQTTGN